MKFQVMKKLLFLGLILLSFWACNSSKTMAVNEDKTSQPKASDTIRIANEELEYEIIIIDPGFNSWVISQAKPRNFYSQSYLEGRNRVYVAEWNNRALQPNRYNPNLYGMRIDYSPGTDYGYEVNYLLYNYLIYFQIKNKQQLAGFVPRQ